MPLRSVEAASRDDAIAAAREQFGPQARVVGVRRVRSGGVLGFFATERYIAEVAESAPDTAGRPAVPARTRADDEAAPADFSSPLASAAPARARATAPARNGAAVYAAEAARPTDDDIPPAVRAAAAAARAARSAGPARAAAVDAPAPGAPPARTAAPTRKSPQAAAPPADEARVSELVGLLAAQQSEPATPAYSRATFPRASFPRTGTVSRPESPRPDDEDAVPAPTYVEDQRDVPAAPSPFTAALARMVAGDRDVRQAVQEALAQPAETRPRDDAEPWPVRSEPVRTAESSVPPPAARQEEETVGDQVIAPPSTTDRPVEVPQWAAAPEAAAASVSPREEAIADLLRGALAQGHSDEALAGILRKVLAGASPQTALTEPGTVAPAGPVFAVPAEPLPAAPAPAFTMPTEPVFTVPNEPVFAVPAQPVPAQPVPAEPVLTQPVSAEPVPAQPVLAQPVFAMRTEPVFAVPADPAPAQSTPAQPCAADTVFAMTAESVDSDPVVPEPVLGAPLTLPVAAPSAAAPFATAPVDPAPVVAVTPVVEAPAAVVETPSSAAPTAAPASTPSEQMWGTPSSSAPLWGESVSATSARAVKAGAPIWADVVSPAAVSTSLFPSSTAVTAPSVVQSPVEAPVEAPVAEAPIAETVVEAPVEAPVAVIPAVETPAVETPAVESLSVESLSVETPVLEQEAEAEAVEESLEEHLEESGIAELAPVLARTASDPAPMMSFDATTVMPPLSLLPPLPSSRGRGRPPVPPAARRPSASSSAPAPSAPASAATDEQERTASATTVASSAESSAPAVGAPAAAPVTHALATVTRLPVAPLMASPDLPELPEDFDELDVDELIEPAAPAAPVAPSVTAHGDVASRLELLGVPGELLGSTFAEDVAERGTYAALTRSLALRLPKAPEVPSGAGETVFVVGPGVDALRAARSLAASLRLDPDRVQWATRGDLAGLAPKNSRVTTVDAAIDHHQESVTAGTVTIVAVDAPLRTDTYWMAQMMTVWTPVAVWAVVEATRKPEDLLPWIDGLPRVDALIVQDTDLSADPAAVLRRVNAPVALLDGVRATPHRWASLLCERLETTTT